MCDVNVSLVPADDGRVSQDLVRKLLFALRIDSFDAAIVPEVVELLLIVVAASFNTETIRHLATYLTATLCPGEPGADERQLRNVQLTSLCRYDVAAGAFRVVRLCPLRTTASDCIRAREDPPRSA